MALIEKLGDILDQLRKLEHERNEALREIRALEQEVSILRELTPDSLSNVRARAHRNPYRTGVLTPEVDGIYNGGFRDRVLRWLAGTLRQETGPEVRRRVAYVLGALGDPRSVQALSAALRDSDDGVRREAAIALGRIGTAQVVAPLAAALGETRDDVRNEVVAALTRVGKPAIPALISGLKGTNVVVRHGSSDALTRMGRRAVLPLTKSLIEEDDKLLRLGAIETLGKLHDERAAASLVVCLMEQEAAIQDAAACALMRTGRPAIRPLVRVLIMAGNPLRQRAAEVLVRTGSLAVRPLIETLADDNPDVRLAASEALARIGSPALGQLRRALKDSRPAIRLEAATVLGLSGDPRAVPPLVQAVKGRDRDLRLNASMALVRIGKPAAAPLVSLLKETDPEIRKRASEALGRIGRPAFEPLCHALNEADLGTRREAALVLSGLRSSGILRGVHGKWERAVDSTLLLAWFSSGWAKGGPDISEPSGDATLQDKGRLSIKRSPGNRKRSLEQSANRP